ncbi:MAG: ABC transporter ATP-binding protein [Bacteroidota bacterium]|nr:ABC transporter ATP-binding protein [Bacteroidota bacterium]
MAQNTHPSLGKAFKTLFGLLFLDKRDIYAIYFFAIIGGLISLSLPLGIQYIISFVQANQLSASIVVLIAVVITGVFFNGYFQVKQMQVIEKIEQKLFVRYSFEFADRLPKLNIEKLDDYHLPELVNRYFDSVSLIKGIEKLLLDIPAALIQILFGVLLLSLYHPVFIAFGVLLIVILIIIIKYTSTLGFETSLKASDYKYTIAAWLEEMAASIKTFKYAKTTSLHLRKTDEAVTGYLQSRTSHFKILLSQFWSFITFKIVITAAMLIVGSALLLNQQINVGQFIAADIVIIAIISSVEKLITSLDKVYDSLTSIEKLGKITDAELEEDGTTILSTVDKGVAIDISNLNFTYHDGNNALENINLQINPGDFVCITGLSGSGKSSLLRILTGAYRNFTGKILIDGIPLSTYNLSSLRSQTGILFNRQDVFRGTLLENITMGNNSISLEEINALAEKIGFTSYIENLKIGLDTLVDPDGKRLPQKVKKEILLMRSLIGKHRLLLLEEPFEHLDEQQIQKLINFLHNDKNATIIITAEHPPKKQFCDVFISLEGGTIKSIQ